MITYLKHNQIDKPKWDEAIMNSLNPFVYALSWYLDIVSPGWEALVEGDYESIMPLPKGPRIGIRYLRQPFFCQQLGVFSHHDKFEDTTSRFLKHLPAKYKLVDIKLNSANVVSDLKYSPTAMPTFCIDLSSQYDEIQKGFSVNTKRNIKKVSQAQVYLSEEITVQEIVEMKKTTGVVPLDTILLTTLTALIEESLKNGTGKKIALKDSAGNNLASVFYLDAFGRIIYLISSSTEEGKRINAMFHIVDSILRLNAGTNKLFDFEGSIVPGVARFFKGFGAKPIYYTHIRFNRFPKIIKTFIN